VLIETFKAKGRSYDDALLNVRNVKYRFIQQDSVLKFDYRLYADRDDLWHDEELYITLKVPINAQVVIDDKLNNMLEGANIYECKQTDKKEHLSFATFVMTDNGLQCKIDTVVIPKKDSTKMAKPDSTTTTPQ